MLITVASPRAIVMEQAEKAREKYPESFSISLQQIVVLRKKFRPISEPDRSKRQTIRLTFIYMHRCLTEVVGDVQFESW